ncbi:GGDEF domain-containing protein [Clostridium sp. DL1XJH146]
MMNINLNSDVLNLLIKYSNLPIIILDTNDNIIFINEDLKESLDININDKNTFNFNNLFSLNYSKEFKIYEYSPSPIYEINVTSKNKLELKGKKFILENSTIIIFESINITDMKIIEKISQLNIEMMGLTRELTKKNIELKKANEKITKLINTDYLTGLSNRREFFDRLNQAISFKTRKNCAEIGLIMADLDFFKKVNDTYGHDFGDKVLVAFSNMLKNNTRNEDTVARIGGEEFVILLSCTDKNSILIIGEKLRKKCEELIIKDMDSTITASFGATYYDSQDSIDSFMKKADDALYEAKKTGRNKVVFRECI